MSNASGALSKVLSEAKSRFKVFQPFARALHGSFRAAPLTGSVELSTIVAEHAEYGAQTSFDR